MKKGRVFIRMKFDKDMLSLYLFKAFFQPDLIKGFHG